MKIVQFSFKVYYLPKTNIWPNIAKRKKKRENWMTDELLNQINGKNDMYVDWKYKSKSVDIYNTRKTNFKRMKELLTKIYKKLKEYIILILLNL